MTARLGDAGKQFEAIRNSVRQLNHLRRQIEQAQKQNANLLKEFLDAVEGNPSQWMFKIVQKEKTIVEGPLNKQALEILRGIVDLMANIRPGEGAGCPDRTACALIGQFGDRCFYLCNTVEFTEGETR